MVLKLDSLIPPNRGTVRHFGPHESISYWRPKETKFLWPSVQTFPLSCASVSTAVDFIPTFMWRLFHSLSHEQTCCLADVQHISDDVLSVLLGTLPRHLDAGGGDSISTE